LVLVVVEVLVKLGRTAPLRPAEMAVMGFHH
jgi:hypothetical protein